MSAAPAVPTGSTLNLLVSLVAKRRTPGSGAESPSNEELDSLLRAAATVPDHGGLKPWRFVVVSGEARTLMGEALVRDLVDTRGPVPESALDKARRKAFAAPTLIVLIASPHTESKVPVWEQLCSAACCGYAVVLAAQALGLGAVWKSTPLREGAAIGDLFGLGAAERLLGWVNVGSTDTEEVALRSEPDLSSLATTLENGGLLPYRPA